MITEPLSGCDNPTDYYRLFVLVGFPFNCDSKVQAVWREVLWWGMVGVSAHQRKQTLLLITRNCESNIQWKINCTPSSMSN